MKDKKELFIIEFVFVFLNAFSHEICRKTKRKKKLDHFKNETIN